MSVALCRACLIETVKLHSIRNTQFQEVYEKLSNTKLVRDDGWPDSVCYNCYMHLQKCYNFSVMSQKAENMLTQFYCNGIKIPTEARATLYKILDLPSTIENSSSSTQYSHPLEVHMTSVDVTIKEEEPDPVKVELVEIGDRLVEDSIEIEVPAANDENDDTRIVGSLKEPEKRRKGKQTHLSQPYCKISSKINNAKENSYICTDSFPENDSLRLHRSYAEEKPYSCDLCDKTFARDKNLKAHIKIHLGEKFSACDRCGKTFPDGYQLKKHMRSHTGEKPYKCEQCHRNFSDRSNLQKHIANHSGEKSFNCTVCNASFAQNGNLRRHMRSHTGEKLFYCEICQKSLPDASLLKRHMRIHTGEKPYVCDACGRAYSDKDNLKRHLRIHTGEKPFACELCDYKSAYAYCLKLHLGKKHSGTQ